MTREDILVLRRRRGLTQESLARLVGVERTYISKIENGHCRAGRHLISRIERALEDVDPTIRCSVP